MADAVNRRAGYLEITVNGTTIEAKGNFDLTVINSKKEGIALANLTVAGYSEKPVVPGGKGMVQKSNKQKAAVMSSMTDGTVVAKCGDGTKFVFSHAWYSGEGVLSTEEGNFAYEWQSKSVDEVA